MLRKFIFRVLNSISFRTRLFEVVYNHCFAPIALRRARKADKVRVLFVLSQLAVWKTERLYLLMKEDPMFEPHIGIEESKEEKGEHLEVEKFCLAHGYEYTFLTKDKSLRELCHPHIVIYQKPYMPQLEDLHRFYLNMDCLFVYVAYGSHAIMESWSYDMPLHNIVSQYYFENELCASSYRKVMRNKGRNIVVTGTPAMDEMNVRREDVADPWKAQDRPKKRIIWAPHHTIGDLHLDGIKYSTFLDYCDFMLELAEKYRDEVQWAFKPHPRLILSLRTLWGDEKAEAYYERWSRLENAQLETGKYVGLFHHSDAMIHDCSSFMIEYHYTRNPVLFLTNDEDHTANLNDFAKRAYELHYKAASAKEIEDFVQRVICGEDPRKAEREEFYQTCLLPPGGKTASENIVEAIKQMLA